MTQEFKVCSNPREVHYSLGDSNKNEYLISFYRQDNGSYKIQCKLKSGISYSLQNFQIPFDEIDLCWAAEDNKWFEVSNMIADGVFKIVSVRSR
jgi:hypothetical protein